MRAKVSRNFCAEPTSWCSFYTFPRVSSMCYSITSSPPPHKRTRRAWISRFKSSASFFLSYSKILSNYRQRFCTVSQTHLLHTIIITCLTRTQGEEGSACGKDDYYNYFWCISFSSLSLTAGIFHLTVKRKCDETTRKLYGKTVTCSTWCDLKSLSSLIRKDGMWCALPLQWISSLIFCRLSHFPSSWILIPRKADAITVKLFQWESVKQNALIVVASHFHGQ